MLELLATADVFLTNIRPTALERIGLDPDTLLDRNERLVYELITGYGLEGPDADTAAYDIAAYWARAGHRQPAHAAGRPTRRSSGAAWATTRGHDGGGHGLRRARRPGVTGKGQLVTTSLLRQGVYTIGFDLNTYLMWGRTIGVGTARRWATRPSTTTLRPTVGGSGSSASRANATGRRWPGSSATPSGWRTTTTTSTPLGRYQNAAELIAKLDEIFATKPLDEWAAMFDTEPDFFWSPFNTLDDVIADEQMHAAGAFVEVPDGVGGTMMVATPVDFHGTPWPAGCAPKLGQHTDEVLAELAARLLPHPSRAAVEAIVGPDHRGRVGGLRGDRRPGGGVGHRGDRAVPGPRGGAEPPGVTTDDGGAGSAVLGSRRDRLWDHWRRRSDRSARPLTACLRAAVGLACPLGDRGAWRGCARRRCDSGPSGWANRWHGGWGAGLR